MEFLKIYRFTEVMYSPEIDKAIRNFIYKKDLMDRWHAYDDNDQLSYKHYAIIITGTPKYKKNQIYLHPIL